MLMRALFITAPDWKPKCPSTGKWTDTVANPNSGATSVVKQMRSLCQHSTDEPHMRYAKQALPQHLKKCFSICKWKISRT